MLEWTNRSCLSTLNLGKDSENQLSAVMKCKCISFSIMNLLNSCTYYKVIILHILATVYFILPKDFLPTNTTNDQQN